MFIEFFSIPHPLAVEFPLIPSLRERIRERGNKIRVIPFTYPDHFRWGG